MRSLYPCPGEQASSHSTAPGAQPCSTDPLKCNLSSLDSYDGASSMLLIGQDPPCAFELRNPACVVSRPRPPRFEPVAKGIKNLLRDLLGGLGVLCCSSAISVAEISIPGATDKQVRIYGTCSGKEVADANRLMTGIYGKSYVSVRKAVLRAHWYPAPSSETSDWRKGTESDSVYNGQEEPFARAGFAELDSCAIDRAAPCRFKFQDKAKNRLLIETEGEEISKRHAYVAFLSLACWPTRLPP